jgi:VWFA-related protein
MNKKKQRSLAAALLLLATGFGRPAPAAEEHPTAAQTPPAEIPIVGETIDVRVVNVEAVVTNAKGERTRGLTAGDFRLLVDGREVPIEYFTEIEEAQSVPAAASGGATPAPVSAGEKVGRNYLIYVDDSYSLPNRRNDVLEKLERDLALLRPEDHAAVLAFDGTRLSTLCGWTSDAGKLHEALAKARQRPAKGNDMLAHQRALQADVNWVEDSADSLASGDSERVGGPKASEIGDILFYLSTRISPEARTQLGKTTEAATAALSGFEVPPGRKILMLLSGAWSLTTAPQLYGPLVEAANRLGYTVYPVDCSQSDAAEVTVLNKVAQATGGRAVTSPQSEVFREVVADTGSYYWLGFTPAWKADDRGHRLTVEVRRPGLQVRSKGGFSDLSHRTEAAMKAESVLLFGGAADDHRLLVELGKPERKGGAFEVPVTLGVPVEALALTPKGKGYVALVPLAVATEEKDGRRSNLSGPTLQVAVETLPKPGTFARFHTVVRLRDPQQRVIFTIHDASTGQALWGDGQAVAAQ